MKELKTSEAQRRAIENWAKKNPDAKGITEIKVMQGLTLESMQRLWKRLKS